MENFKWQSKDQQQNTTSLGPDTRHLGRNNLTKRTRQFLENLEGANRKTRNWGEAWETAQCRVKNEAIWKAHASSWGGALLPIDTWGKPRDGWQFQCYGLYVYVPPELHELINGPFQGGWTQSV